jgi:DNA adenine methylase
MSKQEVKDAYREANPKVSKSTKRRTKLKQVGLNPYKDLSDQEVTKSVAKKLPSELKEAIKTAAEKKKEVKFVPLVEALPDTEPKPKNITIKKKEKKEEPKKRIPKVTIDGKKYYLQNSKIGDKEYYITTEKDPFGNKLIIEKNGDLFGIYDTADEEVFTKDEFNNVSEAIKQFGEKAVRWYINEQFLDLNEKDIVGKGIRGGQLTPEIRQQLIQLLQLPANRERLALFRQLLVGHLTEGLQFIDTFYNQFQGTQQYQEYMRNGHQYFNSVIVSMEDDDEETLGPDAMTEATEDEDDVTLGSDDVTLDGGAISDWASSKAWSEYKTAVVKGRNNYPPRMRKIIQKYGDKEITRMFACRTPLPALLTSALNAVSLGEFGKKWGDLPYDKLFHLDLRVDVLEDPNSSKIQTILLEKNEVLNSALNPTKSKTTECELISVFPRPMTLNKMLAGAQKIQGDKFFTYSAYNNNCQDFVMALLRGVKAGTQENYDFIKQNTRELFKNLPGTRKFANTVTDTLATFSTIIEGAGPVMSKPVQEESDKVVQPIFCRVGGKTPIIEDILKVIPQHTTYVEAFAGGASVFWNKSKAKQNVLNDLDAELIDGYKALKKASTNPADYPFIDDENEKVRKDKMNEFISKDHKDPTAKVMKTIYKTCNTYGATGKGKIVLTRHQKTKLNLVPYFINKIKSNVAITSQDYKAVLKKYDGPSTFFFLDPPYEKSGGLYKSSYIDYEEMADLLKKLKGKFLVTINDSPEIRKVFEDFNIYPIKVKSQSRGKGNFKGVRDELFITNYEISKKERF